MHIGNNSILPLMRISFDLDDTLICRQTETPAEPGLPWLARLLSTQEPLRLGTLALMRQLQSEGWELWIYTTSLRKPSMVRRWFRFHGIVIAKVINQDTHQAAAIRAATGTWPSKNPAAFGIDLHVDDSQGVYLEGQQYGFAVIVVDVNDQSWAARVSAAAKSVNAC